MRRNSLRKIVIALGLAVFALVMTVSVVSASSVRELRIEDKCDVATFPSASGCQGNGGVSFQEFLAKLNPQDGGHGAWRFNFGREHINVSETLKAINVGGEPHTFTKVQTFGGGCVPDLNTPLGLTPVAECSDPNLFNSTFVAANNSLEMEGVNLGVGTHNFQCLIHPWMQIAIEVRSD